MKLYKTFEKMIDECRLYMIGYKDNNSYIKIKVMDNNEANLFVKKTMNFIENIQKTFNPSDIKYNHSYHPLASIDNPNVFQSEIKIWW